MAIKPQFDGIDRYSGGIARVWRGGRFGFIDTSGRSIVQPGYTDAGHCFEGLAAVRAVRRFGPFRLSDKWGYIDATGRVVIAPKFDWTSGFREGLAVVEYKTKSPKGAAFPTTSRFGFIDRTGSLVVPPRFDGARPFRERLAAVRVDADTSSTDRFSSGKWGYIDRHGTLVIPCTFDGASDFSDGLAAVMFGKAHNSVWHYIDSTGRVVVTTRFAAARDFHEGLAAVRYPISLVIAHVGNFPYTKDELWSGLWGFIDRKGEFLFEPVFQQALDFSDGQAVVQLRGKWGYVDRRRMFREDPEAALIAQRVLYGQHR